MSTSLDNVVASGVEDTLPLAQKTDVVQFECSWIA